jgi:1,2-diacylglycerol 3-beta-galactosyltransferase
MAIAAQRTILFLIADTGAGHRSAANAISNALQLLVQQEQGRQRGSFSDCEGTWVETSRLSEYQIEIVDVFAQYSRFPLREAMKLYGPTIRYNPRLFGRVFHQSNRVETIRALQELVTPLILNGLLRLFTSVKPDLIVSVHPLVNFVTIRALKELELKIPFVTVVTDLVSIHHAWFAPGAQAYIVPTEAARQIYLQRELDPAQVYVLGMPIDPRFSQSVLSKVCLQQRLGLRPRLPVVLLVGGGDGAGGLRRSVQAISQARLPVQLIVVTGRNKRLYTYLQRMRPKLHVPAKILGFVSNMPDLMHAADIIVTKAGPGTICEALACDLPVILSGYVPGQEEGNVRYVVEQQVGVMAFNATTLVSELQRLLVEDSPVLQQWRENAKRISRPEAAFDIARALLSFLPPPHETSIWQSAKVQERQVAFANRLQLVYPLRRLRSHSKHGGNMGITSPLFRSGIRKLF